MDSNFMNLAQANPSKLVAARNGVKGKHCCTVGDRAGGSSILAICISLIQATTCHISEPTMSFGGQIIKQILGLHHSLENEHLQSCCCVIFGAMGMQAPIHDGVLTFRTKPEKPSE